MGKCCVDCRFSTVGEFNEPMVVSHEYETDKFTFEKSVDEIIAIPVYELECEHEINWRPSRGNMLVNIEHSCKHFEPK